jgi:hypothetical protein
MASAPQFVGTPQVWATSLSAANPDRTGATGTVASLVTGAAPPGTRVDKVRIMGVGTVSAGMIRFFLFDSTTTRLIKERPVLATVPSSTVGGWEDEWTLQDGLYLPTASWQLKVATNNAENFNVFAFGGNL